MKDIFPLTHKILKILMNLPISNTSAETPISLLRHHHILLRSTVIEIRLTSFTLLNIHRDIDIDINIIRHFSKSKRKL